MATGPEYTFLAEFPCAKHCQVEMDLTDLHLTFTLRQMRQAADREHEQQHPEIRPPAKPKKPSGAPIYDGLQATFHPANR